MAAVPVPAGPLRWGLLSTASINDLVLRGCAGSPLVQFEAVASRSRDTAESWARSRGIARAWGSYDELLADPQVDAVYISLPNAMHLDWADRALAAGKHVLCEKPLARDPDAVRRTYALARAQGLVFGEAFMYRHHEQTAVVTDALESGLIGELELFQASLSFCMPEEERPHRLAAELDAGALMDLGCYPVDMARRWLGEITTAYGEQIASGYGVDMRFAGMLGFASGATAQFDCAMDLPPRNRATVIGTAGELHLPDPWHCGGDPPVLSTRDGARALTVPVADPYRLEFEAMARAVAGEPIPAFGETDAVAQARVLRALYASAASGRRVAIDHGDDRQLVTT